MTPNDLSSNDAPVKILKLQLTGKYEPLCIEHG